MRKLDQNIVRISEILKVLGHPARVEVLRLIFNSKEKQLTVKQIHEHLAISQPEASKHLLVMKAKDILISERRYGHSFYKINDSLVLIKSLMAGMKLK